MNGEIGQMVDIVIGVRKALCENSKLDFAPGKFVLSIKFAFAPMIFGWKDTEADSVSEWFEICKKRRLYDIKFIIPTATEQRHLLGFSNSSRGSIICFWENGRVTCFYPVWKFDREHNGWNVIYREEARVNVQREEISFTGRTEEFKKVLSDIGDFATEIGFPGFSDIFHRAYEALCDSAKVEKIGALPQLPHEFRGIYYAVDTADVFGAMGSWNDSPPWYAQKKGLEKEYNELSDRLLKQIRYHLMYIANECWQKN